MAKSNRFEIVSKEGNAMTNAQRVILVDQETGVNYLFVESGYAGGLTPLLGADGKPLVSWPEG